LAVGALVLGVIITSHGSPQGAGSTPDVGPTASAPGSAPSQSPNASSTTPLASSSTGAAGVPATTAMPDSRLTPGETIVGVTVAEVCTSGWATSHRAVAAAQYREVYGEYRIPYPEPSGTYELDHLIPLELGGDNANANLWPEAATPPPGFHQKDELENALHALVCAGSLGLGAAQHDIASNWYAAYVRYVIG
jgi:hypothetical protein